MNEEKFKKLIDEVEEFIAGYELSNPHYLFDEEVIKHFSEYKKKHVRRALEEVR